MRIIARSGLQADVALNRDIFLVADGGVCSAFSMFKNDPIDLEPWRFVLPALVSELMHVHVIRLVE